MPSDNLPNHSADYIEGFRVGYERAKTEPPDAMPPDGYPWTTSQDEPRDTADEVVVTIEAQLESAVAHGVEGSADTAKETGPCVEGAEWVLRVPDPSPPSCKSKLPGSSVESALKCHLPWLHAGDHRAISLAGHLYSWKPSRGAEA